MTALRPRFIEAIDWKGKWTTTRVVVRPRLQAQVGLKNPFRLLLAPPAG